MSKINYIIGLIALVNIFFPSFISASILEIENQSNAEILNILVEPIHKNADPIFLRLDLAPGAKDKIENPGVRANLRVDTGLQLWLYENVYLEEAINLLFCGKYPGCLALRNKKGDLVYEAFGLEELVPVKGSKPVCELSSFHPMMPMKEVCAILERDMPRDDNGACLTGLGFAGKVWAARLTPFQNGPISENSLLEHMELRRKLSLGDVMDVLETLYKQDYVPWQAEFPGKDMDFSDATSKEEQINKDTLTRVIEKFLKEKPPKKLDNPEDDDGEASILLAPVSSLKALANADNPPEDVQLFTMVLKPMSSTLLLDVTAYSGDKGESKPN